MMKYAIILATVAVMAYAQRPPYAGSANRYPQVLPQFLPKTTNGVDSTTELAQRIGEDTVVNTAEPDYKPYDPYNDQKLLDQIATWPKEKQPFWYLNRKQIQEHLGVTNKQTS